MAAYKEIDLDRVGCALDCPVLAGSTNRNDSHEDERVNECRLNVELGEGLGRRHVGKDENKRREIDVKSDTSFPLLF
jgi:hypothetical protein